MDPLSVTASVIAIVGALRAVTKGYKSLTREEKFWACTARLRLRWRSASQMDSHAGKRERIKFTDWPLGVLRGV